MQRVNAIVTGGQVANSRSNDPVFVARIDLFHFGRLRRSRGADRSICVLSVEMRFVRKEHVVPRSNVADGTLCSVYRIAFEKAEAPNVVDRPISAYRARR